MTGMRWIIGGDSWDDDVDGDGVINLLDPDADGDGIQDGQELADGTDPSGPTASFPFETSEVSVDHIWKQVSLSKAYQDPVVVAKPMSSNEADPAVIRIRNVTQDSFEIRIQEWDYLDGSHVQESVSYLVMEQGHFSLPDGTQVEAGTFQTDSSASVDFQLGFAATPVVTAAITSDNDPAAVTGRLSNTDPSGFSYELQEEAADQSHAQESVTYIAWEPGTGEMEGISYEVGRTEDVVTDAQHYITLSQGFTSVPAFLADMQTSDGGDTANVRSLHKDIYGVEVTIAEEASNDAETGHTTEAVGYMLFE